MGKRRGWFLVGLVLALVAACGGGGAARGDAVGAQDVSFDGAGADDVDAGVACDDVGRATELPEEDALSAREELPDPLVMLDGTPVTTPEDWWCRRRPEILRVLQHYAYGYTPAAAGAATWETVVSLSDFLDGEATLEILRVNAGPGAGLAFDLLLVVPNDLEVPPPVFLGLNFFGNHSVHADSRIPLSEAWIPERGEGVVDNRATEASRGTSAYRWPVALLAERGYALATLYHGDIDPDFDDFTNGVHPLFHEGTEGERNLHEWGAIGAWAWGLSRAVDVLVEHPRVDGGRIAVMGHSRNGKAALWAAAQDERIALAVSNMSGCMGAAISRRREGETLAWLNTMFPHWLALAARDFNEREAFLPFDQHHLIALVAPRPVLVASAAEDAWADPPGEFLGAQAAAPVWELLGASGLDAAEMPAVNTLVESVVGYHVRPGGHDVGEDDWRVFLRFADVNLR